MLNTNLSVREVPGESTQAVVVESADILAPDIISFAERNGAAYREGRKTEYFVILPNAEPKFYSLLELYKALSAELCPGAHFCTDSGETGHIEIAPYTYPRIVFQKAREIGFLRPGEEHLYVNLWGTGVKKVTLQELLNEINKGRESEAERARQKHIAEEQSYNRWFALNNPDYDPFWGGDEFDEDDDLARRQEDELYRSLY